MILSAVIWLHATAAPASAECTPDICSGDPCTISGTHDLDDFCILDFGIKDVTIGANTTLRSAENDLGEFTIRARKLTHKGLLRAAEGDITIIVTESLTTLDPAGSGDNAGRINVNDSDCGGTVTIRAGGTVNIATNVTAKPEGDIEISGCDVTLSGTLDASGDTLGSVTVAYRQSFTFGSGAEMRADDECNSLECVDDGSGNCLHNPIGLTCVPDEDGDVFCSSGSAITPPASLDPVNLGPCAGCGNHVVETGEACDDGNVDECDGCSSSCESQGNGDSCADEGNPCTNDVCAFGNCSHSPTSGPCDDGNPCTTGDQCSGGVCIGGPPPSCDDGDACTIDACSPASGCTHSSSGNCDDGNTCTTDSCDPAVGCMNELRAECLVPIVSLLLGSACGDGVLDSGEACDDGNTVGGDCCSSTCQFEAAGSPCDDGAPCTASDSCDGTGACTPGPVCLVNNVCGAACGTTLFCQLNEGGSCACAAP